MSDFNLARESIEEMLDFSVLITETELPDIEQRRLKGAATVVGYKIQSPCLTKTQMQVYRDIFLDKFGAATAFTFTSPFDDVEYTVRFVPGTFRTMYEAGVFRCSFDFKKVAV